MRSHPLEQLPNSEQYKYAISVDVWEFWNLEGGPGGQDRTLNRTGIGAGPALYSREVLHEGDLVHITLDQARLTDSEHKSFVLALSQKPIPDYDLVGVVEWVRPSESEPFRIDAIRFSSVRRVARQ